MLLGAVVAAVTSAGPIAFLCLVIWIGVEIARLRAQRVRQHGREADFFDPN
jgi:hypothetical protein